MRHVIGVTRNEAEFAAIAGIEIELLAARTIAIRYNPRSIGLRAAVDPGFDREGSRKERGKINAHDVPGITVGRANGAESGSRISVVRVVAGQTQSRVEILAV